MQALSVLWLLLLSQPAQQAVIPIGTRVDARLQSAVRTATSASGDTITAVITEPLRAGEKIVVPRGSRLHGRVETITPADNTTEGRVRLAFREIELPDGRRLTTWITDSFSASPPKRTQRYALLIGLGAAAGGVVGGHAARVAGIIGGALVGFIIVANSGNGNLPDLALKPGQMLHLRLGEDLKLE